MAVISFKERINAPIDQIFEVMTDISNSPEFISGITNVEMISDGEIGVGTRWKESRVMFGKTSVEEMWITEFVPNDHFVVEAESCGAKYRTEFKFRSVDNYTTDVTMEMNVTPVTFAAKLMAPLSYFMKNTVIKAIKKDLDDARVVCQERFQKDSKSSVR